MTIAARFGRGIHQRPVIDLRNLLSDALTGQFRSGAGRRSWFLRHQLNVPLSGVQPGSTARLSCDTSTSELGECIHLPQVSPAQELQVKAETRLASLMEEKLVTRISVLSTLLGGGKTTERLLVRISIETHKTSPDFDQTAADKAKNRIRQALGDIGCDVFIETDR